MSTSETRSTTSKRTETGSTTTKGAEDARCCNIDIRIKSQGDVNIYNCTAPPPSREPCPPPPPEERPCPPIAPGQCVPLALGAKPKQSERRKMEKLLENNRVPSALAASFFQVSRRFLAGRSPANSFEQGAFDILRALPPDLKGILSCSLASYDALQPGERDRLFDPTLPPDPNVPIDGAMLATAVAKEITQRAGLLIYGDPTGLEEERPGQNRFFDPGTSEPFESQLRICTVNDLRTNVFEPELKPGDYTTAELQHQCEPVLVNGQVVPNCQVQTENCPGNAIHGFCLRVPEVEPGQAVVLQGVNFITVDATVRLAAQPPGTATREVDAHVVGDIDTPLTEVVNGVTKPIHDCRVHDCLTFNVPDDLPEGIYMFQVVIPNTTGFPALGDPIRSDPQYLRVRTPATARFEIYSERLCAQQETSPAKFGSDEVRVRVRAYPLTAGPTEVILGAEQAFDSPEFNLDSGDCPDMKALLFTHQEHITGLVMTIMGFEIDSETAYREQIDSFTEAFLHYLKYALAFILGVGTVGAFIVGIKELLALALAYWLPVLIAVIIVLAVIAILARWAPADLIIADAIGLTTGDLAALTSVDFPLPAESKHTTQDIKVLVVPMEKTATQYRERRDYVSDDEESRYEIYFRYNRVA